MGTIRKGARVCALFPRSRSNPLYRHPACPNPSSPATPTRHPVGAQPSSRTYVRDPPAFCILSLAEGFLRSTLFHVRNDTEAQPVIPNDPNRHPSSPRGAHHGAPRGDEGSPRICILFLAEGFFCSLTSPRWGSCAASSKCFCKQVFLLASGGMTEERDTPSLFCPVGARIWNYEVSALFIRL